MIEVKYYVRKGIGPYNIKFVTPYVVAGNTAFCFSSFYLRELAKFRKLPRTWKPDVIRMPGLGAFILEMPQDIIREGKFIMKRSEFLKKLNKNDPFTREFIRTVESLNPK